MFCALNQNIALILTLDDVPSARPFARDMVSDEGETETAWRIQDNRRQRLSRGLSGEEHSQLEQASTEHKRQGQGGKEAGQWIS